MKSAKRLYEMTPRQLEAEAKAAEQRGDTRWAHICREEISLIGRIQERFREWCSDNGTESRNV